MSIYLTTVQSLFDYSLTVWGPSSKTNITYLQKLQNLCARAVTGIFDNNISVSNLITSHGWMTIYQRLIYFTACLVFKCLHNSAPSYLSHNLNYISEYHQYNTRSAESNNLVIPRPDTSLYTHSFTYFGPKIWNLLPTTVRSCNNIHLFITIFIFCYHYCLINGQFMIIIILYIIRFSLYWLYCHL